MLHLSGPHDLVQAIPYLVGFPPRRSVVVVALAGPRHRVLMTARVDLDADPVAALQPAWSAARRQGATAVLLSVHDDVSGAVGLPWRSLADELRAAAAARGLDVIDTLLVGPDRFWSYLCRERSCCPAEGRPVEPAGVVAAELVLRGRGLVTTREDLAAELTPDPGRAARVSTWVPRLAGVTGDLRARRAAGVALVDALVQGSSEVALDDAHAARALVALADVWVRDSQFGQRPGSGDERAGRLWSDLARAAPPGLRAAPLVLRAASSYRSGDGARANAALEVIDAEEPGYPMARLLGQAMSAALSPQVVGAWLDHAACEVRHKLDDGDDDFR